MKELNTCGFLCPKPLIMLKDALMGMQAGEGIKILTDNATSQKNLVTFLREQGVEPRIEKAGNVYTILTEVPGKDLSRINPETFCSTDNASRDYVICIRKNRMGDGDAELGRILLETFINNINQQETLPSHLIFYNEGVLLTKKDSPVIDSLIELENVGIKIMVCGTCIEFYNIQKEIGAGMISNMVTITEKLVNASHIIYP